MAVLIISRMSPVLHSLQRYPALKSLITDHTILLISFPPWSIHPKLICVFCQSPYRWNCFSINVRPLPPPTDLLKKKKKTRKKSLLFYKECHLERLLITTCLFWIVLFCIVSCCSIVSSTGQSLCLPCPDYCSVQCTLMAL